MREVRLDELPKILTDDIVEVLMEMAWRQSPEWKKIWDNWSYENKEEYCNIKSRINSKRFKQELEYKRQYQTQDDWDKEFLAFWGMYVDRERPFTDYTVEDIIEMTMQPDFYTKDKLDEIGVDWKIRDYILLRQTTIDSNELFSFFWATKSPFSQWHKAKFTAASLLVGNKETKEKVIQNLFPLDVQEFSSAEQFMMYHKAMIFLDREIAQQIMKTDDVRKIKELGRQVKNYDENVWQYFRSDVVYAGNKAKFTQNDKLKQVLFATKGATLVEAAPNDNIWGIGLAEDDPRALKRESWLGKNLLGEILTQIRIELMEDC